MNASTRTFIQPTLRHCAPVLAMLGALVLVCPPAATAGADDNEGPCSKTAEAMRIACGNEVRGDYWVAIANCINLSSDRHECREDARGERDEGAEDCDDQLQARNEVCDDLGQARYDPEINPDDFVSPAQAAADPNPFMPLVPGSEWVYQGDGEMVTVTVTGETKEILGVLCTVVRDVVTQGGVPVEDTLDWFAQDEDGNVWYMGELSQEFEDGELKSLEGSWQAGVDGAKPGIVMPASPQVGDIYRQEFFLGDAEDMAEVVSLTGDDSAPAADCNGACLVVEETTPISPDALEHKFYVAGTGLILEVDPETGEHGIELISVNIP